ncbi:hypothetical protein LguiB_010294 [Lonicera macranthoides]
MADHQHHHHQNHRPHRLSLPQRPSIPTSRPYPLYPPTSTPTPTPSKTRNFSSISSISKKSQTTKTNSLSFPLLLLFSLRSLYSLLPFLKSSPSSFSLFPFSFLLSLLSFLLTLCFSFLTTPKNSSLVFSLTLITPNQTKFLVFKSLIAAVVFLLRFQALRYCGTAAMILAELSGNVAARFVAEGNNRSFIGRDLIAFSKVRGFFALFLGLFLLSVSWDRIDCFPLSSVNVGKSEFYVVPSGNCVRFWPMLLPFLSGFLGCYERISMNWGTIRELGRKRVRLISLFFTTVVLFVPAVISMFVFEAEGDSVSIHDLGWPLANMVVFGVLLSENFTDEKVVSSKDFQREFIVTFACTLVLELFYFPELSLWGLLVCGLLLWIAVRQLDPLYWNYLELGLESADSLMTSITKVIRHILSERKSRKIALFLLINTGYMVVEFVVGFMSNSLGLISDACHMLFDCAALAIGLYASYISRLPANSQFNYGRGRFEVLSGYVNAVFLVLVGALIVVESLERILDPQEISTSSLLTVSIGGLLVNVVGLIFFHEEHHHAHGGSSACSHSHSDHHHSHDHEVHKHQEHITVVHDCHEKSAHDDHHHKHNNCSHDHHHHEDTHANDHDHDLHNHGYGGRAHGHGDHDNDHGQHDHHHHADQHTHDEGGHVVHHHSGGETHALGDSHSHSHTSDPKKKHHRHIDHNMEGIFLHVLADTMGSVGVVLSTLLIQYKGWLAADPACSIFISILIVSSVIPLLRNSGEILLQRVPRAHEQDLNEALKDVMKIKGVQGIQNLHVWSFTNNDVVGTLHLHVSTETNKAYAKARVSDILHDAGVKDLTVQVECVKE